MPLLKTPVAMFATSNHNLLVVGGGKAQEIPLPVPPFYIDQCAPGTEGSEEVQLIGFNEPKVHIKKNFLQRLPIEDGPEGRFRLTMDYVLDVIREFPDAVRGVGEIIGGPEGYDPYPIFIDIETADSLRPERGEILSIQIGYTDCEDIFLCVDGEQDERALISQFIAYCNESPTGKTPDIMVSYNGNKFDIPYLMGRCRKHGMMALWHTMDRTQATVFTPQWLRPGKGKEIIQVAKGFMSYDLYIHAKADGSLARLPRRDLKSVASFYGSEDVIELEKSRKMAMRTLLQEEPELFREYAMSDIRQTRYLWGVYSHRTAAEANVLNVPFIMAHRMSSGQKSYLALYRKARERGFFALAKNMDRYRFLYERAPKYQGAIVDSWGHGYYDKIIYADAASMYPNIMYDFNLSPDRYRLVGFEEYERGIDSGVISVSGPAEAKRIRIPDDNYRMYLDFEIDLVNDGYMRELITYFNNIRKEYKRRAKEYESGKDHETRTKFLMYDSMQMAAKIINNTYYGINGNRYYEIGDLPQAIFVTALGRWIISEVIKFFGGSPGVPREDGSYGTTVLEVDSVLGNTPIYVRHRELGCVDIIPIESLHGNSDRKRVPYSGEYEILTRNGWKRIIYTKRHKVRKDIWRVKLSDGFIDCTEDHSLFKLDNNIPTECSPKMLQKGDTIELTTAPEIGNQIGTLPLNKDLAWFYGLYLAEGSITSSKQPYTKSNGKTYACSKTNFSLSMQDREVLELACRICNEHLSPFCSTKYRPARVKIYDTNTSSATWRLTGFYNITARNFFRQHFYVRGSDMKKIPVDILNCTNKEILDAFLDGYSIGDGCFKHHTHRGYTRFREDYDSSDTALAAGIRFLLNRVGKRTRLALRDDKPSNVNLRVRNKWLNGQWRTIDKSAVLSSRPLFQEETHWVYDVSTEDGTFVSAFGEIVAHNTDGVLLDRSDIVIDVEALNTHLKRRIHEFFGVPLEKIQTLMEFEGAGSIYLYKQKNYILRKDGSEKLIIKGSAFVGYDRAPVISRVPRIMSEAIMLGTYDFEDAKNMCRDIRVPLDDFKFTKTLQKAPDEYKGYEDVDVYVRATELTGSEKQQLRAMKTRAREWIDKRFDEKSNAHKIAKNLIKDAQSYDQLITVIDLLRESTGRSAAASYFLLDLITQSINRGHPVSEDTMIEYFWTKTPSGYSLAEDVESVDQLDLERYMTEINNIIERFEYADPIKEEMKLF